MSDEDIDVYEEEEEYEEETPTKRSKAKGFAELKGVLSKGKEGLLYKEGWGAPDVVSSGVWGFDYVSAIGGAPFGRSIEFNGKESAGKTTLALLIAAKAQEKGHPVVFLDYEQALDTVYAKKLGIDFSDDLWALIRPTCIEEGELAFDHYIATSINSGIPYVFIQDSLPAMIPRAFLGTADERIKRMGLQARMQGEFLTKAGRGLARSNSLLISLNQMRANMGAATMFAAKDKASGSHANKHFQSQIYNLTMIGKETEETEDEFSSKKDKGVSYLKVRITNKKNKVGVPLRGALLYLKIGESFDNFRNLLDAAIEKKIIKRGGAWYSVPKYLKDGSGKPKQVQGLKGLGEMLKENPEVVPDILRDLGWLQEDGSMNFGNTYAEYDSDPTSDEDE